MRDRSTEAWRLRLARSAAGAHWHRYRGMRATRRLAKNDGCKRVRDLGEGDGTDLALNRPD